MRLVWDQSGDRIFETGLDRGVLYLDDRSGVPWNGLTSIDENPDESPEMLYFDGNRFGGDEPNKHFGAKLTAVTYPDEFLEFDGYSFLDSGVMIDNQKSKAFHLSYRTLVGNDIDGVEHGYKIHILYNLTSSPSGGTNETIGDGVEPSSFEWDLSSIPEKVPGYRPTAHAVIDSRYLNPEILADVEGILYGTDETDPHIPSLADLTKHITEWGLIIIIDHGDGSWSASGPDEFFTMLDETTFQITDVFGEYLDLNTYQISSSVPD